MQMFLVVEFLWDKSTAIIQNEWFNDGSTLWPNYQNDERINRAILSKEEPSEGWQKYDVRIVIRSSDYLKARKKLKEAQYNDTDALQSEEDNDRGKRKRKSR